MSKAHRNKGQLIVYNEMMSGSKSFCDAVGKDEESDFDDFEDEAPDIQRESTIKLVNSYRKLAEPKPFYMNAC